MQRIHRVIAVVAMFILTLAILITCIQAAVYMDSDYKFYEKTYQKYHVTQALDMRMEDVMMVTDYMMAYLIGDEEELSIKTMVEGTQQDFFNEQDRAHMKDVKTLFLKGLYLRNICLIASIFLVLILIWRRVNIRRVLPSSYLIGLAVFVVVSVLLGILFATDFTKYFTIFHELFFTNDLWIFDPETDYMIRMLPEGFFFDMLMRIGVIFISVLMMTGILSIGLLKKNKNR